MLARPALATDPCEDNFRAGMAAYRTLDSRLTDIEATLYAGFGWVTRSCVLARLEDRSATTSACQQAVGCAFIAHHESLRSVRNECAPHTHPPRPESSRRRRAGAGSADMRGATGTTVLPHPGGLAL